jgi:hypothetical protein
VKVRIGDVFERTSKKGLGQRVRVVRFSDQDGDVVLLNPLVTVMNISTGRKSVMYLKRLEGPRFLRISKGRA